MIVDNSNTDAENQTGALRGNLSNRSSYEHSILSSLNAQQQLKLSDILDDYLAKLGAGEQPDHRRIIQDNPELEEALQVYLSKLTELQHFLTPQSDEDLAGRVIDGFKLGQQIGRGGMGIVYEAWQDSLQRKVAVKILPSAGIVDPKFVERFAIEARASAMLDHPNIVPVYATGQANGVPYYVMKLIQGHSLEHEIALKREMSGADSRPITQSVTELKELLLQFAELADAIQEAHEVGIVHRDIKPSNILQSDDGKLWLADFGLARMAGEGSVTRTGELVGTVRYMSPEQALGPRETVDYRTDIYSLAATLFEAITLRPLIEGDENAELLAAIARVQLPSMHTLVKNCPNDLEVVLERATARHKDDRYLNAAALRDDLRRVANGESIVARRISAAVKSLRWASEHKRLVATALPVGLMMVAWLIVSNLMIRSEQQRTEEALLIAHRTVDDFNSRLVDELEKLPGAEKLRKGVIEQTLAYYEDFAKQSADDFKMQMSLANAHTRMGTLYEELGDTQKAVSQFRIAEELYALHLVGNAQSNQFDSKSPFELQRRMIDNRNHLALANRNSDGGAKDALKVQKMLQNTLNLSQSFLEQAKSSELNENKPSSIDELELQHALTQNNYGSFLMENADWNSASKYLNASIKTLRALKQQRPENESIARGLAAALHNQGKLYSMQNDGDLKAAIAAFRSSIDQQLNLAISLGNRLRVSPDLINTYIELGTIQLHSGDAAAAESSFANATMIASNLLNDVPGQMKLHWQYATALSNHGLALCRIDRKREGLGEFEKAVEQLQLVLQKNPDAVGPRKDLLVVQNNRARMLADIDQLQPAFALYQQVEQMIAANPDVAKSMNLRPIYQNYLQTAAQLGNIEKAREIEKTLSSMSEQTDFGSKQKVKLVHE